MKDLKETQGSRAENARTSWKSAGNEEKKLGRRDAEAAGQAGSPRRRRRNRRGQGPPDRRRAEARPAPNLAKLETELLALQGEKPLVLPVVGSQAVAEVVSGWTGIPVGKMVRDEINAVLTLEESAQGARHRPGSTPWTAIAERIRTARANLADPRRPIGVFLLVGPSGVGKTETAMALADILYGGDRNMVIINMSEYKEDHKISRLTGSAPGYVGYGEGGVLTEAVRRKPYSVVLLDEVEKANDRRAGNLLPGLRQGHAPGRQGQRDQLQEHDHPPDLQRRHRHDHEAVRRPRHHARSGRPGRGAAAGSAQGVQAGAAWAA